MTVNKEPEISDKEWFMIDSFIQDLLLVKKTKHLNLLEIDYFRN